jgi:S1-C subfamily serine protease
VRGIDDLFDALEAAADGQIDLAIVRGAEERTVAVTLSEATDDEQESGDG